MVRTFEKFTTYNKVIKDAKDIYKMEHSTVSTPTYYLWKTEEMREEVWEELKQHWSSLGFRIVTFLDGNSNKDIHEGLKAVIQNHLSS